ncbi:DUF4386 domain-containing protein [Maritimibacter sp. UBA3975]|uniref:DUF4386 domain-containing protein n=1 Tax=Maritimibacter sp. UBA3975 TaxID=1946833 RepID=UPI000C0B7748|nr:DUF4386 domain-containing protein [Maritimibacter sp. UBA3975]MAM61421.1 hypothetical protein [Maritimibacter sp.]|tara:strand:- start:38864 stop:39541 length:678 start_codon:yes stop_codon:yes gene_type:complete
MSQDLKSHRLAARLFGIFFILAFASYGAGSGLVASVTGNVLGLEGVAAHKTTLMIGVILMATVHSVVTIGLSVLAYPVLKTVSGYFARGYFAAGITATTTAVIGALFLALLAPLSDAYVVNGIETGSYDAVALVLERGGFYGYQLSMTLWGVGGLILCTSLLIGRLVPRMLAVWGLVGYVVFMVGTTAEMFGYGIGTMLALPGGLFEISLSLWLIFKGFRLPTTA